MIEASANFEPSDEVLVARVACGDLTAFALLYERYARPVHALAAHLLGMGDAEEVVQDAFLRLWRHAGQFDPERGAFSTWFMAVARHQVRAELRRRGRRAGFAAIGDIEQLLATVPDGATGPEDAVWQQERALAVRRALADLPPEQRRVLLLAYFGDQSQSAIAQALGWPLGTVKKRLRLGIQKLRERLEGMEETTSSEARTERAIIGVVGHENGEQSHEL